MRTSMHLLSEGDTIEWSEDLRPKTFPEEFEGFNWDFLNVRRRGMVLEVRRQFWGGLKLLVLSETGQLLVMSDSKVEYLCGSADEKPRLSHRRGEEMTFTGTEGLLTVGAGPKRLG